MKRSGIEIIVYGKVQGVFFRKFTREEAQKSGLKGFVKNKDDGTVFIRAFGDNEALFQFTQWCKTGPSRAEVTKLVTKTIPYEDFNSFEIQR